MTPLTPIQLIRFYSFKSLTSVFFSLTKCPMKENTLLSNPREFEADKEALVSEIDTLVSDLKLFKFD